MKKQTEQIKSAAEKEIKKAQNNQAIENLRIKYLGRKGKLTQLIQKIPQLPRDQRQEIGLLINKAKKKIQLALTKQAQIIKRKRETKTAWVDTTAPGHLPPIGHLHPTTLAFREIWPLFEKLSFTLTSYPEIEWEWFAFEALNMPAGHPARDDFETFFLDAKPHPKMGRMVLTPHTSSGQIREMRRVDPPIRMINIAKCYRINWDNTHIPMFHQFEGLVIDKNINLTHLKGIFEYFAKNFYGPNRKIRLRPSHFQFTEPSFEVDIDCPFCRSKGCKACKSGWHELGGSGMVHPKVLENGGIDPRKYSGFAFGWGIERTYMMKSGLKLDDIRILYENDLRFIEQF